MFENQLLLVLLLPLVLIQISLAIYVILSIEKNGVRTLNKALWLVIGLLGGIIGSIVFIMYGKRRDEDD
ncbi:MAG TPA: hypothetical protein PLP48_05645 [Acholeplasmataceae bacterium]|nr:hypothetical protein [Acholeplasmataceae bacterium]